MKFRAFKIIQGHPYWCRQKSRTVCRHNVQLITLFLKLRRLYDFGTNRNRVCDFLLVRRCDYGPILHRFWDTATYWLEIAYFSYPSLIRRLRSLCSLWNFAVKLTIRKLWGYSHGARGYSIQPNPTHVRLWPAAQINKRQRMRCFIRSHLHYKVQTRCCCVYNGRSVEQWWLW